MAITKTIKTANNLYLMFLSNKIKYNFKKIIKLNDINYTVIRYKKLFIIIKYKIISFC